MSKKAKKRIIAAVVLTVLAAASVFCAWFFLGGRTGGPAVSVEKVSVITGMDGGVVNRFAGIVEPAATQEIYLEASRTLSKTYVEVGEEIDAGHALLAYDVEELELQMEQMELDISRIESEIDSTNKQIDILKKQRDKATASLQLEYTTQIRSYEAQVKQSEYNLKARKLDLERIKDSIDNSVVYSEIAGTVRSISDGASRSGGSSDGSSEAYMVIMSPDEFRVKGEINEQNITDLAAGAAVTIRSRRSESQSWKGVIDYVDVENPVSSANSYYYSGGDELSRSSKYPFYITLDSSYGLMTGQHVFIEPDSGTAARSGVWLLEYYIMTDEAGSYVWAVDQKRDRIEKRYVTLGSYDSATRCYEITAGLTGDDEIAFPEAGIYEGQAVTREGFTGYTDGSYVPQVTDTPISTAEPGTETEPVASTEPGEDGEVTPPEVNTSIPPASGSNVTTPTENEPATDAGLGEYGN